MLLEAITELNKENPEKSEIMIQGYGKLGLDQTKQGVIKRLEEAVSFIKNNDNPRAWRNAQQLIYGNGVIDAMMKSIVEANQEIEDMQSGEV